MLGMFVVVARVWGRLSLDCMIAPPVAHYEAQAASRATQGGTIMTSSNVKLGLQFFSVA